MLNRTSYNLQEIVGAVYDSALDYEKLQDLIAAWDTEFESISYDAEILKAFSQTKDGLVRHFERADHIFLATSDQEDLSLNNVLSKEPTAAFITNKCGKVLAANYAAQGCLGIVQGKTIQDLLLDAKASKQVSRIFRNLMNKGHDPSMALRGTKSDNQEIFVLIVELYQGEAEIPGATPLFLFKSSIATWHPEIASVLQSAFDLTEAEINVIEGLNNGLCLKSIANHRGRSVNTIRTQMKSILYKTETQSQTNLMRHVTSLLLVANSSSSKRSCESSIDERKNDPVTTVIDNHNSSIRFRDYGPENGFPVVLFTPVLSPKLDAHFRETLQSLGLRPITVEEPGNRIISFAANKDALDNYLGRFKTVIEHLNLTKVSLLGYCGGGVYATHFAEQYPECVHQVFCVDTGAPLSKRAQWQSMPTNPKRSFFIAKNWPEILVMPHRIFRKKLSSGPKGERKCLEYFYGDHLADTKLMTDTRIRNWSLDMLQYSLSNIERTIRSVQFWAQDWSAVLLRVSNTVPITFIHGDENRQFPLDDVVSISEKNANITVVLAEGAAQLTMITHTELIAETILDGLSVSAKISELTVSC